MNGFQKKAEYFSTHYKMSAYISSSFQYILNISTHHFQSLMLDAPVQPLLQLELVPHSRYSLLSQPWPVHRRQLSLSHLHRQVLLWDVKWLPFLSSFNQYMNLLTNCSKNSKCEILLKA